jgi:hypothetical protein
MMLFNVFTGKAMPLKLKKARCNTQQVGYIECNPTTAFSVSHCQNVLILFIFYTLF